MTKEESKLFNGLMLYLRTVGSVGGNIDMDKDDVEYYDGIFWTANGQKVPLIEPFKSYIKNLCQKYGGELWDSTNKEDIIWMLDVSIFPKEKEVELLSKYQENTSNKYKKDWDWQDIPRKKVDYIGDVFEKNKNVEKIIFDCTIRWDDFELTGISLGYKNGKVGRAEVSDYFMLQGEVFRLLKFEIMGEMDYDDIADSEGFDAVIVCGREENSSYVDLEVYDREWKDGKKIKINQENLIESKMYLTEEEKDEIFKGYIDIVEPFDSNPNNLNIDKIQNNARFAKLLNTILFELYEDNLGMNEDDSQYGILDIHTLNEFTNWSILNYFGGHKFVKNRLLDRFNKTSNPKTLKEFYRWLIENQERLFKDGPVLKELIRTNFNTYNKGSITEKYVIDKLKNSNYKIKYYPPGSKKDREGGIDIEINGVSYQIKELTGIDKTIDEVILKTPFPKNYLGLEVQRIMLVDISTGEFFSFPNENYTIDTKDPSYVIKNDFKDKIKNGYF